MKTTYPKKEDVKINWHLVDAKNEVLGRLATKIASLLKGKHKADYSPHIDMGDAVVVINSGAIKVTGKKLTEKMYKRFSGYPGGLHLESMESLLKRRPTEVLRNAVKGMLPKNRLGRRMIKRLKLNAGGGHNQIAQKPKAIKW